MNNLRFYIGEHKYVVLFIDHDRLMNSILYHFYHYNIACIFLPLIKQSIINENIHSVQYFISYHQSSKPSKRNR